MNTNKPHIVEAVANANAYLNNVNLPVYDAVINVLRRVVEEITDTDGSVTPRTAQLAWNVLNHATAEFKPQKRKEIDGRFWLQTRSPSGSWNDDIASSSLVTVQNHGRYVRDSGRQCRIVTKELSIIQEL